MCMGEIETSLKAEDDTADISILEFGSNRTEESSSKLLHMQQNIHKLKSTIPTQIDQYVVIIWENELKSYNEHKMQALLCLLHKRL